MTAGESITRRRTGRAAGNGPAWVRRISVWLGLLLGIVPVAVAAQKAPTEYQVKAAYLYNFGKFVKWHHPPAGDGSAFTICVLGEDPFGGALQSIVEGEKIDDKPATVLHVHSTRSAASCNILFISRSEVDRVSEILRSVGRSGPLTVSDIPDFVNRGGMIEFVNQAGRIRFDINLTAAQRAGLDLSSELLKVANVVKGKGKEKP